ncbi:hypothetical protein QWZ16_10555 [Vibrio ostreicida]|uniref:Uncharacterized protein n=1 Tax=Vibrio ostreicida TaxID=526588 RepID=A0ABT8BT36_9VIBR|nr:hypothetical protein [Vibrio ostreicida]MDN3610141.1 hypothetical protein [Vibrio ostreicida]
MDIEIYMPCEPQWFCDALLAIFSGLFFLSILVFSILVYKEYRKINRVTPRRRRKVDPRHKK